MGWSLDGKRALVTGGSGGIGRATALGLARRGARVVITGRDQARTEEAAGALGRAAGGEVMGLPLQLEDLHAVEAFAESYRARVGSLDLLINNAGAFIAPRRESAQGLEATYAVNHLGPFLLTRLLLPLLTDRREARVLILASGAHRAAAGAPDPDYGKAAPYRAFDAYARSKLANILFARELANRLAETSIKVAALHPGVVRTGLGGRGDSRGLWGWGLRLFLTAGMTPEGGAAASQMLASTPVFPAPSGSYFHGGLFGTALKKPSRRARDADLAADCWAESESLIRERGGIDLTPL